MPFPLDLHEGRAYVSLVAFTMRDMAPRRGGRWTSWMLRPIATHEFLNVRTYVRSHVGEGPDVEEGIHFLHEWLPNRLAVGWGDRCSVCPIGWGGCATITGMRKVS